jgi:hypothetical protein
MSVFQLLRSTYAALLNPIKVATIHAQLNPFLTAENNVILGTHDGTFHCDEALALGMLLLHPSYQSNVHIIRTRNPSQLAVRLLFFNKK